MLFKVTTLCGNLLCSNRYLTHLDKRNKKKLVKKKLYVYVSHPPELKKECTFNTIKQLLIMRL